MHSAPSRPTGLACGQPEDKLRPGPIPMASAMFYIYMLASKPYGTLYIGTTSDLVRRMWEHKNKVVRGFTKRYGVHQLVWFEVYESRDAALQREKQIKEWKRDWKINLIERENRHWNDLSLTLTL
jgi:putative endonuclease